MATIVRSAERLIGLFAFFVEEGATVDGQTISASVFPDNSPTSNWPSIGTVLPGSAYEVDEEDDSYLKPLPGGGHRRINKKIVMEDRLRVQTREMSGLVDRLLHGLTGPVTEGTPMSPGIESDRFIRGWFLVQARQKGGNGDGTDDFVEMRWCEIRLAEQPKFENKAASPSLMIHFVPNPLDTINFPAAA